MKKKTYLKIKAQLYCDSDIAFGPGKADLLDAIERTGSISAAARDMGLSYRRAWLLVDTMNRCFRLPLVETGRGGNERGGAIVTPFGDGVRARYRTLQRALTKAAESHAEKLTHDLKD